MSGEFKIHYYQTGVRHLPKQEMLSPCATTPVCLKVQHPSATVPQSLWHSDSVRNDSSPQCRKSSSLEMESSFDNYFPPGFNGKHCYGLNKYVSSYNSYVKILNSKGEEGWVGRAVGRCLWLWNPRELDYCLKKEALERSLAPSTLWGHSKKCQLWTRKNTLMRMWLWRCLDIGLQFPELWEINCHCFISLLVCNSLL